MLKRTLLGLTAMALLSVPLLAVQAETVKQEAAEHPRIAKAISELEEAIKYLEAAPHNFGGHKAKAIADSRASTAPGWAGAESLVYPASDFPVSIEALISSHSRRRRGSAPAAPRERGASPRSSAAHRPATQIHRVRNSKSICRVWMAVDSRSPAHTRPARP